MTFPKSFQCCEDLHRNWDLYWGRPFLPLCASDYHAAKYVDAFLWIVGIIGVLGLVKALPVGSIGSWCMTGCGGGSAFILTLYLVRDRHKSYEIPVLCNSQTTHIRVTASQKLSSLREQLSVRDSQRKFYNHGQTLDENKTFGEQDLIPFPLSFSWIEFRT